MDSLIPSPTMPRRLATGPPSAGSGTGFMTQQNIYPELQPIDFLPGIPDGSEFGQMDFGFGNSWDGTINDFDGSQLYPFDGFFFGGGGGGGGQQGGMGNGGT